MVIEHPRILLIDDNEDILFMVRAMLKLKGYDVSIKQDIVDLETFIKCLSPDVILMDMLLPGADGRAICKCLKSDVSLSSIPIIMISANSFAKAECLEAGANYFIEKPFEMNDLYKVVSKALK